MVSTFSVGFDIIGLLGFVISVYHLWREGRPIVVFECVLDRGQKEYRFRVTNTSKFPIMVTDINLWKLYKWPKEKINYDIFPRGMTIEDELRQKWPEQGVNACINCIVSSGETRLFDVKGMNELVPFKACITWWRSSPWIFPSYPIVLRRSQKVLNALSQNPLPIN